MLASKCKCDVKSWLLLGFVIAVLYFGLDNFFHNYCMRNTYQTYSHLFGDPAKMMNLRWVSYIGYLLFALLFTCIFAAGYEEGKSKAGQGLRYGLLIGIFYWGARLLVAYPYMPWPKRLIAGWFAIGLFECVLLGFITGMLYKPKLNDQ